MAIYTKIEYLKLCGLDTSIKSNKDKFSQWLRRGNIELNDDNMVDDSNPKNRDWLFKQRDLANKPQDEEYVPEPTKKEAKPKPIISPSDSGSENIYNIDKKIKAQQLEKLQVDTRLQLLKEEKIRGEVLPVDLIRSIFATHSQSILTSFKDSIEDILIDISKRCNMSSERLAKSRENMIHALNKAVDKSIDVSKRQIKSIVDEYSVKKEVGEHE